MAELLEAIAERLGTGGLLTEASDRRAYEEGWRYGSGSAWAVARPRSTAETAWLLAEAKRRGVRVLAVGGNTSLVGAATPDASGEQLVVSLERLAPPIELDPLGRTVVVGAGMTLSQLNAELAPHGLMLPIDLGADPQIGGMIATNTGGTRLLRYGSMRRHVLGLEVVLPDGTVTGDLGRLRKDNRGLSTRELFIGTTGAFGIVTRAALSLEPLPRARATAWAGLQSAAAAERLLAHLRREADDFLTAYEVLSRTALESTMRHGANLRAPFGDELPERAVLVELSTQLAPERLDLDALLFDVLAEFCAEHESDVLDMVPQRPDDAWHLRHQVSESLRHEGELLALDVSVPCGSIAAFTDAITADLQTRFPGVRVADFGHWGDGGTHLNLILGDAQTDGLRREAQAFVYDRVGELGGSFSAEHGVGPHNHARYVTDASEAKLGAARALADFFDPERRMGNVRLEG
ncbi:MAG: FAD-binding oxidoreductase [Planctomycetota bacterium]